MDAEFKRQVRDVLQRQELYHLIPMYDSTYEIPQRVNRYGRELFVVFNPKTQNYEIHSLEHDGHLPSIQCVLPYKNLDARVEIYLQKYDIRIHGQEIYREIDRSKERHEKAKARADRNMLRDVIGETQSMFAKDAWTFGT